MTRCASWVFYRDMMGRSGHTVRRYLLRGYFIVGATFRLQFVGDGEVVGSDVRVDAGCHAFTLVRGIEAINLFEITSVEFSGPLEDDRSVGRGTRDAELYTDFAFDGLKFIRQA